MKFNIIVKLYDSIDHMTNKQCMEKVTIPLHPIYNTYETADKVMINMMYMIDKNVHALHDYTHFIHAYVVQEGVEVERELQVFPQGRTFLSYTDAKKFIKDFSDTIVSMKEL